MNILAHNKKAWDGLVEKQDRWTVPVTPEIIRDARAGRWSILLTPEKPVPRDWFPGLQGLEVLCLAGAGGQQAPILAAAGAKVTVLDNSPRQLSQDRAVAKREGLSIETVEGDMRDLTCFPAGKFDLIFHPCSNCFVPDVRPVWKESYRVLREGGVLLAGFINPALFIFDEKLADQGELQVRHRLPYSDLHSLTEKEQAEVISAGKPLAFSHSLTDLLGGQLDAGFTLTHMFEDGFQDQIITKYMPAFIATRAVKSKKFNSEDRDRRT
jgi:SAM-dependent methyltransferase